MTEIDALIRDATVAGVFFITDGADVLRFRSRRKPADVLLARLRTASKAELVAALRRWPMCAECRARIIDAVGAWYGGHPVHLACGEAAWRRDWQAKAPGAPVIAA